MDNEQLQERRRENDRWQFKREISVGNLLTAVVITSTIFAFGSSIVSQLRDQNTALEKRITVIEEKQVMQSRIDQMQDTSRNEGLREIKQTLDDIQHFLREHKQ